MEAPTKRSCDPDLHEEYFRAYYNTLFPAELFVNWLSYGNESGVPGADPSFFACREFAFEAGSTFARYVSFKDAKALRDFLVHRRPQKIDIGAVYNVDPSKRSTYTGMGDGFYCKERELVFDIDMDEYDDVRTCCQEGKMCHKDWSYMAAAIQVIDSSLREDFGFEHILWVYSGRRGVHCWVCDHRARCLTDRERSGVADYLTVYKGHQKGSVALNVSNIAHPSIQRAYKICNAIWFERVLPEQRLFESDIHARAIFDLIGDARIEAAATQTMSKYEGDINQAVWQRILYEVKKLESSKSARKLFEELSQRLEKVVLSHVYPRLDIMVSRTRNHLLKAPFCVHPKTGRICVPIPLDALSDFSPEEVVTVKELYDQMEENYNTDRGSGVEGTSLYPYITHFSSFLAEMESPNLTHLESRARSRIQ